MKWYKKYEQWHGAYYVARYKNFEITVDVQNDGFSRKVIGYYFYMGNKKTGDRFNSLWSFKPYPTVEAAKEAAKNWIDEFLNSRGGDD